MAAPMEMKNVIVTGWVSQEADRIQDAGYCLRSVVLDTPQCPRGGEGGGKEQHQVDGKVELCAMLD